MSTRTRRRPSIFLLERYLMASLALLAILLIETAYLHASLEHHLRSTTIASTAANDGSSGSTALLVFQHESQARGGTTSSRSSTTTTNHAIPASPWLWKKSTGSDESHQVVKKDKNGKVVHHSITKLTAAELGSDTTTSSHVVSMEEAIQGRERLVALLQDAGVHDTEPAALAQLPKWNEIAALYYTTTSDDTDVTDQGPVLVGLDTCAQFRESVPPDDASIGVAGLFNTGTNPLAMYLAANCVMPHSPNKHDHGMRWQVPWGKHMLAQRKWNNTAAHDQHVDKSHVLPVVLVRDPYTWSQSMCQHPYAAKWKHGKKHCPNLVEEDGSSVNVSIGYPGQTAHWDSLVHLWSDWYNQYLAADYPRLLVRYVQHSTKLGYNVIL